MSVLFFSVRRPAFSVQKLTKRYALGAFTLEIMNLAGYSAFLTLGYWFNMRPVAMPGTWIISLEILFGLFAAGGIAFSVLAKRKDNFLTKRLLRASRLCWTVAILGLLWLFFSYEGAVLLGARFWFLLIMISAVVWAIFIVLDIKKNLSREMAAQAEKERFERYLPKKKK